MNNDYKFDLDEPDNTTQHAPDRFAKRRQEQRMYGGVGRWEPVTVQQTSKGWKALRAVGFMSATIGFPMVFFSASPLFWMIVVACGVAMWSIGAAGRWWHHG